MTGWLQVEVVSRPSLLYAMTRFCTLCVLAALLGFVACKVTDRRGPLNLSFSKMAVFNEKPCQMEGGQCLEKSECPEGKLAPSGKCPEQQKRGVECCHGVSVNVKDCRGQGGECWPSSEKCPPYLVVPADDCNSHEICCVQVN